MSVPPRMVRVLEWKWKSYGLTKTDVRQKYVIELIRFLCLILVTYHCILFHCIFSNLRKIALWRQQRNIFQKVHYAIYGLSSNKNNIFYKEYRNLK